MMHRYCLLLSLSFLIHLEPANGRSFLPQKFNLLVRGTKPRPDFSSKLYQSDLVSQISKEKTMLPFVPISQSEFPKFFALSSMMFWIVFIFTMARDTKDTLIVTSCGAEAISFLKVYGVVPAATIFMFIYSYFSNVVTSKVSYHHNVVAWTPY
jgi:hypothetical protein